MKRVLSFLSLSALAAAALPLRAATVQDFAKTFAVTVPAGLADEPLSDFPLLVRLCTDIQGFDYSDFRQNGADILVTDGAGDPLPHELENWDPSDESRLWVQVPSVAAGTVVHVYYGSTNAVTPVPGMWSGYAGVWHLNETGDGGVPVLDSTTNHLDGVAASDNKGSLAVAGGALGGARRIAQDNEHQPGIVVPATNGLQKAAVDRLGTDFHASFWIRAKGDVKWSNIIGRRKGDKGTSWGFAFHGDSSDANQSKYMRVFSNSTVFQKTQGKIGEYLRETAGGVWKKVDVVWKYASNANSPVAVIYTNGVPAETVTLPAAVALQNANIGIGCSTQDQYGGGDDIRKGRRLNGEMDEVRLRYGAASAARIAAEWRQESGAVSAVCGAAGNVDDSAPELGAPSIVRNADGTFTATVSISGNDAAAGSVKCLAGGLEFAMATADASLPKTYSATLSGLPANSTLSYSVQARSTGGTTVSRNGTDTFHTGNLSVAIIADGDEDGLVPGVFRISRADSALELPFSFSLGGTAVEGRSYRTLPHAAAIPAGTTFADVEIHPLLDSVLDEDSTVVLTLEPGLYGIAAPGSATTTISNLVLSADRNTWIATDAGLASDGANWSFGHAPLANEHVLFDGRFSNASCTWDDTATDTVAAWTQNNGYTGTVTVCTVFPGKGSFTNLAVTGAMVVDAGSVTHPQSRVMGDNRKDSWDWLGDLLANETYRLSVSAGSLHVGADGALDARGKGYWATNNSARFTYASHGGRMGATAPPCYGDPKEPVHIGLPHRQGSNAHNGKGGGAIRLTVAGAAVVDGLVAADGWDGQLNTEGNYVGAFGAAGSVWIEADALTGTGSITADGPGMVEAGIAVPPGVNIETNMKGTGGRVSIRTRVPVARETFARITAEGCWMGSPTATWSAQWSGGSGTVVFRDAVRTNGLLVIAQQANADAPNLNPQYPTFWRCPSVTTNGDWTFDAIEFGHRGFLRVPPGTTLSLPGGFASCYGTETLADAIGGIRYEGGTLDVGPGDQTISGNWMFVPWTNFVFQGNVVVTNGAAIGFHPLTDNREGADGPVVLPMCSFEVPGDLTVAAGCLLRATDCGVLKTVVTNAAGEIPGVLGAYAHGGRAFFLGRDASGAWLSRAYDSVFDPAMPGSAPVSINGRKCGGVLRATVGGTLRLDGNATASGLPASRENNGWAGGAGGALRIVAGRLEGSGTIKANGGNYDNAGGPGGRIAVRLTAPGADFSDFPGPIEAGGGSWLKNVAGSPVQVSSAGTVYLETAADGDKAGTIRIAMDPINIGYIKKQLLPKGVDNTNTTEMVSLGHGGDPLKDYRHVRYVVSDWGRAAVNADFKARSVEIADLTAFLDLEGHTLSVDEFFYAVDDGEGGLKTRHVGSGTHSAASLAALGVPTVYDSSPGATGRLVVRGRETIMILR